MKVARSLLVFSLLLLALVPSALAQESAPAAAPAAQQNSGAPQNSNPPANPDNSQPSPDQNKLPPITITSGLVHLVATVTDKRRAYITDLDQSDFKVLENGIPQQIRFFGRETDLPLRIGLLLDTSNSIRPRLSFEQEAAIDFLNRVIRRNKDMAFRKWCRRLPAISRCSPMRFTTSARAAAPR
jgi:hypothetical protein